MNAREKKRKTKETKEKPLRFKKNELNNIYI